MGLRCVAAAARAAATAPGLRLFVFGALGGGGRRLCGVWESGVSRRFSTEGERMRTSGLLGAGGGEAGAAGWAKLGAVAEAVRSLIQAVHTSWACRHLSTFAILQASCHRRISACSHTPFGVLRRACSAAAGACVSRSTLAPLLRARCTLGFGRAFLLCSMQGEAPRTLGGRVHADGAVSANPEPMAARQEHEDALDVTFSCLSAATSRGTSLRIRGREPAE